MMKIIQLKINEKVYDKFLWLLSKFSKEEIEIVNENNSTTSQNYLQSELSDTTSYVSENDIENIQKGIEEITNKSESFKFLNVEEDIYSVDDLIEKY